MLLNPSNNSITPPVPLSCYLTTILNIHCFVSSHSNILFGFFFTFIITFLSLCILILYHGLCEWKRKHPTSSAAVSHSDYFTYHTIIMDLIGVLGCTFLCCGIYSNDFNMLCGGSILWVYSWFGETSFHILTCVERYLAVVHPIIYINLRNKKGIRIRNISAVCVWLIDILGMGSVMMKIVYLTLNLGFMILTVTVVMFCSLSVLYVLIRPNPGEKPGERVNQSKKRAFYTIVAILGVLVLRFIGNLVWAALYLLKSDNECFVFVVMIWFTLPSSLVLPLLLLHKAGKSVCFKINF